MKKFNPTTAIIRYTFKMLTMPKGTTFEIANCPVNRFVYIRETVKMLNKAIR